VLLNVRFVTKIILSRWTKSCGKLHKNLQWIQCGYALFWLRNLQFRLWIKRKLLNTLVLCSYMIVEHDTVDPCYFEIHVLLLQWQLTESYILYKVDLFDAKNCLQKNFYSDEQSHDLKQKEYAENNDCIWRKCGLVLVVARWLLLLRKRETEWRSKRV